MKLPVVGKAHEAGASAPFRWFIYGSSLDREAFAAWATEHGYRMPDFGTAFAARLDGYRLSFDVLSRFWGGPVGSLLPAEGSSVEGLVLPLGGDARGLVDHKEGAISGLYEAFPVTAVRLDSGEAVDVYAYRTTAARRLPKEGAPAPRWLETVIKGARDAGLSEPYVSSLTTMQRSSQ
jgi:gamma-glutamylcyclotransferase